MNVQRTYPNEQKADCPAAAYNAGFQYEKGLGVPAPDAVKGRRLYRKAARLNYPPAQLNMGLLILYGRSVSHLFLIQPESFSLSAFQPFSQPVRQPASQPATQSS